MDELKEIKEELNKQTKPKPTMAGLANKILDQPIEKDVEDIRADVKNIL